jgi:hypothetical protein
MGMLSQADRKRLLSNRYVEKITSSNVSFTSEFKIMAVEKNLAGRTPTEIFTEAGIDTSLFHEELPRKSIFRWKKIYLADGAQGLADEKRGRKATGRPKDQKFASIEAELEYLRLENEFLKKLHALANLKVKKSSR